MELHNLKKTVKKKKRVGRGNSSGSGTYSGRGMKGQGQRKSPHVKRGFEGGQSAFIVRMPKLRGFKSPNKINYQIVALSKLESAKSNDIISLEYLYENKIVSNKRKPAKIVGVKDYKFDKKLKLGDNVACSNTLNSIFGLSLDKKNEDETKTEAKKKDVSEGKDEKPGDE